MIFRVKAKEGLPPELELLPPLGLLLELPPPLGQLLEILPPELLLPPPACGGLQLTQTVSHFPKKLHFSLQLQPQKNTVVN